MKKFAIGLVLFFLIIFIAIKSVNFNGGIIIGSPDEEVHAEVVKSLINTKIPAYGDDGFYFDLPAYFTVSALLSSLFFHNPIFSLRFTSFLASLLSALIVSFYLSKKENLKTAVFVFLLYFMVPLTWYYLRVAVIEPFLIFGMVGAACFFDLARTERKLVYSFISGLFLGLAFLTKYSILPIFVVMAGYFFYDLIIGNKNFLKNKYVYLSLYSFIPIFLGLSIFLPIFYYFYKIDPVTFKWQTLQILGFYGGVKQELRLSRFLDFPWWFSWPIVSLSFIGVVRSVVNYRRFLPVLLFTFVMLVVVLNRLPFYPRYALTLVPFLSILSALGLSGFKSLKILVILAIVIVGVNLVPILNAYKSADEYLIEDSVDKVKEQNLKPKWVFSNYWPNYFGTVMGADNFAWLTDDGSDLRAFAPGENRDAFTILKSEGGVVFMENLYADLFLTQPTGRLRTINELRKNYKPDFTIKSDKPNFPHTRKSGDSVDVYIFKPL